MSSPYIYTVPTSHANASPCRPWRNVRDANTDYLDPRAVSGPCAQALYKGVRLRIRVYFGSSTNAANMNPNVHISVTGLSWVSSTLQTIPKGAVEGGHRGDNKEPLYLALVQAPNGKFHPAYVARSFEDGAHYYDESAEKTSDNFFVLVCDPDVVTLKWVEARNGQIPAYTVYAAGELYIGRQDQKGDLLVGEVNTSERTCIVVTGENVYRFFDYEVLCAIPHGPTTASDR